MKTLKTMIIGAFLFITGTGMFLQKLTFSDPSNQGFLGELFGMLFGNSQPKQMAGTLFVAICVSALVFVIFQNMLTFLLMTGSVIFAVLAVINNMAVTVASMSGLEIGVMAAMIIMGFGLLLNSMFKFGTATYSQGGTTC